MIYVYFLKEKLHACPSPHASNFWLCEIAVLSSLWVIIYTLTLILIVGR